MDGKNRLSQTTEKNGSYWSHLRVGESDTLCLKLEFTLIEAK